MMERVFYVKAPDDGRFVVVKFGQEGYYELDYQIGQEEADDLNRILKNFPAEVEAALICSMWGGWDEFEAKVSKIAGRLAIESAKAKGAWK